MSNEKTKSIAADPLIYKISELPNRRVAAMGHFSLFYKTTDDAIIVMAFWDNRQDSKKLLEFSKAPYGKEA